jgi:hypothetical protein
MGRCGVDWNGLVEQVGTGGTDRNGLEPPGNELEPDAKGLEGLKRIEIERKVYAFDGREPASDPGYNEILDVNCELV